MVAIAPNQTTAVHAAGPAPVAAVAAPERSERRWSGRRTLVFVVLASAVGWCAIGYAVFALLRH